MAFDCREELVVDRRSGSLLCLGGGSGGLLVGGGGLDGLSSLDGLGFDLLGGGDGLTTHLDNLAGDSLILADGVLGTTGITLGLDLGNADLLRLELVDGFHQDVLVLELVTLGTEVELVVDVLVDLLGVTVLPEEATEDTGAADGEHLGGHTRISATLTVTGTLMATLALFGLVSLDTGAGVHGDLASDDEAILVQLADVLAGVGKSDFLALVGVNPNALLSTLEDGGSKPSLQSEHSHFVCKLLNNN